MRTICVDFDGVLHAYESGWHGADVVADGPVPGAMPWLAALVNEGFDVCIYSSRSRQNGGISAMIEALQRWGLDAHALDALSFPTEKPAAFLTIDDRAICFCGDFSEVSPEIINNFRPWNKQ